MFCDQTQLKLIGGDGGKGCISFRREKFVAKGGPNGGDGGSGGSIFLKVNHALNSLIHLHTYKKFQAEEGEMGLGSNCHGKNGKDLYLEVPQGTIIREIIRDAKGGVKKHEIADLSKKDAILLIVRGGKGGFGNAHFVSSVRQAPRFAELGEKGEEKEVELELKLVADIGIIGIPSAGKSSLISVISNARPKIADYPFTTLIPNLGVVKIDEKKSYVVADIPGLIEGAHEGKGLGIAFLKHVQRCRILVHLIDSTQQDVSSWSSNKLWENLQNFNYNPEAALKNFDLINQELSSFSKDLAGKAQIIVINKSDLIAEAEKSELFKFLKKKISRKKKFLLYPASISCATREGISALKSFLFHELEKIEKPQWLKEDVMASSNDRQSEAIPRLSETYGIAKDHILYRPHLENPKYFAVEKIKKGIFKVTGKRITQIVAMTDFYNPEARLRVEDVFKKTGIQKELKKLGAEDGDIVMIGKHRLEFS